MHKVISNIQDKVSIPILHIADATAMEIKKQEIQTIGLLGTTYTMEQDFYKSRIEENGIKVIVPNETDREIVNRIIYNELCLGKVNQTSRDVYKEIINRFVQNGAEGIILGCTEIGLLIKQEDSQVPVFDTAIIHAVAAVNTALD